MKSFNIRSISISFFLLAGIAFAAMGQNPFKASAVVGMTAAQLGGDSISGYDKLGVTFGLKLSYDVGNKLDLSMELLYAQRGSRDAIGFSGGGNNTTTLNYLEIPVYLTLNDWYLEKDNYYKVGIFAGLTYGYLISATSTNRLLRDREFEFKDHDISGRLGVYYAFSKKLTLRTYYTDSFVKLLEGNLFNTDGLNSFFWTFRLDYNF